MQSLELFESLSSTPARMRMAAGTCIRVNAGRLWLTVEGQADDFWLTAGTHWCAPCDMVAWLSGEPGAAFAVSRPVRQSPRTGFFTARVGTVILAAFY